MNEFTGARLNDDIKIGKLYTVHYFEFDKNYNFTGEMHDFWEIVYADKGDAVIYADDNVFTLKRGNAYFHKPNEWHNICANGVEAPNITIVTFECKSKCMKFFENGYFSVGQRQKELLSKIIVEYTRAFETPLSNPYTRVLHKRNNIPFASCQLIKLYLCEFLISFIRNDYSPEQTGSRNVNINNTSLELILNYMSENICSSVTLGDIAVYSGLNRTYIEKLFSDSFGMGAVAYFHNEKICLAKKYLREDNYNITQIADILGYTSIHYFSRQFKKITGMTPTEYNLSIKSMISGK